MGISQRSLFLQNLAQTSHEPLLLEVERAEGVWMYGQGKKYLDLISGISVSSVGHCHPKVVEAVQNQAARYMHLMVYGEVVQDIQNEAAAAILATLPEKLDTIYFLNSGSEAIEAAIKLAKRFMDRPELVCCENAYHGSSSGAMSMIGTEEFRQNYMPLLPGIRRIRFNDVESLDVITDNTAAVFIETVQGEAGVRLPTQEFVEALNQKLSETCALLVCDEIQAGFGRTGTFWAFEQFGLSPDIMVMAKGMGGGMPIGAMVANKAVMNRFAERPILGHITTFGGHPVSCAASLATLKVLQEDQLYSLAKAKAARFIAQLTAPQIIEIRSCGLLMALELGSFEKVKQVIDIALEHGVFTDWFLFCNTALRIAPPIIISDEEISFATEILNMAIAKAFE